MKSYELTGIDSPGQTTSCLAQPPKLLVSIRSAAEARIALAGGADWIDMKEPLAGPLGAVEVEVARAIVASVSARRPLSAALGELTSWADSRARHLLEVPEISVVKLGLSQCTREDNWMRRWTEAAQEVRAAEKELVAVVYADAQQAQAPPPLEIVSLASACSCRYLLIDTFSKHGASLPTYLSRQSLGEILQLAKKSGLQTVVAGGLVQETLGQLPHGPIDLIGVRGAVCEAGRSSAMRRDLVERFCGAMADRWPG
ncbi:MAG: (5-formylfuran-3-yl)methyl phosphate synthase [Pirellulales bacterium]|nr:(5-formylfuran-3-yl)methyl phosphate synthase [Pirellulales bacterium]